VSDLHLSLFITFTGILYKKSMKRVPYILLYIILVVIWCLLFYHFLAPEKNGQLILLLLSGCAFYSLIWGLMVSLFQRLLGWKGYGMLLIPVVIMIVFLVGMDRSTFLFMIGLTIISELVSLTKIFSYRRRNAG
jgi:hypothetical protein